MSREISVTTTSVSAGAAGRYCPHASSSEWRQTFFFFFCVATLCSTHNASSHQCQAAQIKLGLNEIYLHPYMQRSSQQLTFLSGLWRITSVRANPRRLTLLMAVAGTPQTGALARPVERSGMSINGGCQFQRGKLVICKRKRCMST